MARQFLITTFASITFLVVPYANGVERGHSSGGAKSESKESPGGSWSEPTHHGGQNQSHHTYSNPSTSEHEASGSGEHNNESKSKSAESSGTHNDAAGAAAVNRRDTPTATGAEGAAAGAAHSNRNAPQASGAEGAAAGAAHANRNEPQASGAEGAAAGAAAVNRNNPKYSGAEGAAAGATAANRKAPQYSGAQGAAAGAAVANRNSPRFSGAAGAAAANRNAPALSGAQGAALGAAAANQNAPAVSGAQGVAVGAAMANQNAPLASGAAGAAVGTAAVRNSFNNYNLFGSQWYGANKEAWAPARWAQGTAWTPTAWDGVSTYVGATSAPVWYDYGTNVKLVNGMVMMNGQPVGTPEEYSLQAAELAQTGAAYTVQPTDEWIPLGVYAMVRDEQQHPQMIFEFAINKQGVLRGNFTDEVTEHTQPIFGAVDPKTQRAAWIVGDHKTTVMEAGLSNLAEGEASALTHKNGKTDHWLLVRLEQPK